MNVGDPKKAAVLGAVALIIVGVAVFQAIPKGGPAKATEVVRAEGQAVAATENKTNEALPKILTSEPFVKPKPPVPAKKDQAAKGADSSQKPELSGSGTAKPVTPLTGALPDVGVSPEAKDGKINPGENTGSSQQLKSEHPSSLTFNGVMDIGGRKAIVTIAGETTETLECGIGSRVAGYKVLEITSHSITLQRDITIFTLELGSAHPL